MPQSTATNFHNSIPSANPETISTYNDPNLSYTNRNSCMNPIAMADQRSYCPSNVPLQTEPYSISQPFHEMPPPSSTTFLPHDSATNGSSIFDGTVNSYSNVNAQNPSDMNFTDSSSPIPNSETFVEVLPSEITCPACILQGKYKKKLQNIYREVFLNSISFKSWLKCKVISQFGAPLFSLLYHLTTFSAKRCICHISQVYKIYFCNSNVLLEFHFMTSQSH